MAYSQNDPQWQNTALGSDSSDPSNPNYGTIGKFGCYVTAIANVCQWAGFDQNPAQVNTFCEQNGLFVSGDLLNRNDVPILLCPNLQFVGFTEWSGPTPMEFFADASDPNIAYIVRIKTPTVPTHFSMVYSTTGMGDLVIDDSWDGVRKLLSHYGDPATILVSASKFVKIVPPAPVEVPVVAPVVPEPTPPVETPQIAPETVVAPEVTSISTTPPTEITGVIVSAPQTKTSPLNKILAILKWLYIKIIGVK